jgi:hypothetical protein
MFQIPVMCPKCGSWNVDPVNQTPFHQLWHTLSGKILYRCEDCAWQGQIVFRRYNLLLFGIIVITVAILLIPLFYN